MKPTFPVCVFHLSVLEFLDLLQRTATTLQRTLLACISRETQYLVFWVLIFLPAWSHYLHTGSGLQAFLVRLHHKLQQSYLVARNVLTSAETSVTVMDFSPQDTSRVCLFQRAYSKTYLSVKEILSAKDVLFS